MLITQRNLSHADDFYALLIESHDQLSTSQSHTMNAALALLLCNHIGQESTIKQALEIARQTALQSD